MTITNKRSLIALLLSIVLVVSLFTVGISATEVASTNEEVTTTVESDSAASEAASEDVSEAASEKESEEAGSETETETAPTTGANDEAIKAKKTTLIINAGIIAAIIIIGVVLCVKFRKKLGEFLRSVKSEFKKITWTSKEQTVKGFLVVLIIAVIFAVALTLMDLAFNTSISSLRNLFN